MATNDIIKLPLNQDSPWYRFRTTLNGVDYILQLRYVARMDRWTLSIYTASNVLVLAGIPVLINRSLTSQYSTLAIPPGALVCLDDSGRELQPTIASFLTDHSLYYVEA